MSVEGLRVAIACVSSAYLTSAGLGTWLAMREGLVGRPLGWDLGLQTVPGFLFGLGTALSAPLSLLVVLILASLAVISGRAVGRRAAGVIALLGAGFSAGMLAEPITWGLLRSGETDTLIALTVIANIVLPCLLLILGLRLRSAIPPSPSPGP